MTVLWRRYSLGRTRRSRAVLGVLWVRLQTRMHTGELEQPNQLYLKEVGSLNAGAPARLFMRARVPPSKSWTSVSPTTRRQAVL